MRNLTKNLSSMSIAFLSIFCSAAPSHGQENIFPTLVGGWRDINSAFTVVITEDGRVFSQDGTLSGAVERKIEGGGNFAFENSRGQRCSYDIAFLGAPMQGATSWGLRNDSKGTGCFRTGVFVKTAEPKATAKTSATDWAGGAREVERDASPLKFTSQCHESHLLLDFIYVDAGNNLRMTSKHIIDNEAPGNYEIFNIADATGAPIKSDREVYVYATRIGAYIWPDQNTPPDNVKYFQFKNSETGVKTFRKVTNGIVFPCKL